MLVNSRATEIETAFENAGGGLINVVHLQEGFDRINHNEFEKACINVPKKIQNSLRQQAFKAGRVLIFRCFNDLSVDPVEIKQSIYGSPIWPKNLIGSIAHTDQFAVAVLAKIQNKKTQLGIGIDAEVFNRVDPSIWPTIFTKDEVALLNQIPATKRNQMATCMFSTKEAFYKAQFPITNGFVEYDEIEILNAPYQASGTLHINHRLESLNDYHISGFYFLYPQRVITGVVITAKN